MQNSNNDNQPTAAMPEQPAVNTEATPNIPPKPTVTINPASQLPPTPQEDSFANASLVLGILSFFSSIIPVCGMLFGVIAIILGAKGLGSSQKSKSAKVGLVLAIFGVLGSIIWGIILLFMDVLSGLPV